MWLPAKTYLGCNVFLRRFFWQFLIIPLSLIWENEQNLFHYELCRTFVGNCKNSNLHSRSVLQIRNKPCNYGFDVHKSLGKLFKISHYVNGVMTPIYDIWFGDQSTKPIEKRTYLGGKDVHLYWPFHISMLWIWSRRSQFKFRKIPFNINWSGQTFCQ